MKTISVRDLQKKVKRCLDAAQKDQVVVTRHGRPAAVITGVEGSDWEDVVLETSASFWKMIQKSRRQKSYPIEEVRRKLL